MNHRREHCECGNPVEVTDGSGPQCRTCFERNRKVLAWHDKTREATVLNAEEWQESQERKRFNHWLYRQRKETQQLAFI